MVSGDSVHGLLTPRQKCHDRKENSKRKLLNSWSLGEQKKDKGGVKNKNIFFQSTPLHLQPELTSEQHIQV